MPQLIHKGKKDNQIADELDVLKLDLDEDDDDVDEPLLL
jgi:hypothetical protein